MEISFGAQTLMFALFSHAGSRAMLGWSEEQVATFGMTFGVAAFMLYMLFIIAELAWKSKAGWGGTAVLFFVSVVGMVGFVAKMIIQTLW